MYIIVGLGNPEEKYLCRAYANATLWNIVIVVNNYKVRRVCLIFCKQLFDKA